MAWLLILLALPALTPWHQSLSYDGKGHWPIRLPVVVRNSNDRPVQGMPVRLEVKKGDETSVLIGQPVRSVRVVAGEGVELLFDLIDPKGEPKREGTVAEGDLILFPVELEARSESKIYIYAGNRNAWLPPDWIRASIANPSFEEGDKLPKGWSAWGIDAKHRMLRQRGGAHTGEWCARCEVEEGAEPTWVKYMQTGILVAEGVRYRFTGWVKAKDVEGKAGWYVHVDGDRPMIVNEVVGWGGSFDWRKVTIEFTVPPTGRRFSCGTVLYGTGTAWFDDAELEVLGADGVEVEPLRPEVRRLERVGDGPPWEEGWRWRAPVVVRNFEGEFREAIVMVDGRRIANAAYKLIGPGRKASLRIVAPSSEINPLKYAGSIGGDIFIRLELPPLSERFAWIYLDEEGRPGASGKVGMSELVGEGNIVEDGGFERGISGWSAPPEKEGISFGRVKEGIDGGWCLKLTVSPEVERVGWVGWRRRVRVEPNRRYMLAAYIKGKGLDGQARVHGHLLREDGSLAEKPFLSTDPPAGEDWTFTSAIVTTPPDCAFIEIHLTVNCHGTVWHDGVALAEVEEGVLGEIEAEKRVELFDAWPVNPLVKVFPDDPPPPEKGEIRVFASRNEYEPFQVAVRAERDMSLSVEASPLRGPNGFRIDPPALYLARYVPVDFPVGYASSTEPDYRRLRPNRRGTDGWVGMWPDPLVPLKGEVRLKPGVTESIWFDLYVPPSAPPGEYRGEVRLSGGGKSIRLPVHLKVWSFVQPKRKHLPALYDLRGGPGWDLFSWKEDKREAVREWYKFLARYNISPSFVEPYPEFRYEEERVRIRADEFDEMARYLLEELGIPKLYAPMLFYACGWSYPPKKIFGLEPFTPEYVRAWKEAYRLFIDHITRKGWRERFVLYVSDEPNERSDVTVEGIARIADMAKEIAPDVPIYSSTWRYIEGLKGHITLWGIGPQGTFPFEVMEERRAAGDRFWFTTDGQMCIDTPFLAIERLLPWLCYKYGVEGYEFWGISWWTYDPWRYGWHRYIRQSAEGKVWRWVRYPNGDGYLTYPGWEVGLEGPVPSIRLLAARDGVDDYELFLALSRFEDERAAEALERAMSLVRIPNAGGRQSASLMPRPDEIQAARATVGETLSALLETEER